MNFIKIIFALTALALMSACSSTDEHGVIVDKKFLFFGSAETIQSDYNS